MDSKKFGSLGSFLSWCYVVILRRSSSCSSFLFFLLVGCKHSLTFRVVLAYIYNFSLINLPYTKTPCFAKVFRYRQVLCCVAANIVARLRGSEFLHCSLRRLVAFGIIMLKKVTVT